MWLKEMRVELVPKHLVFFDGFVDYRGVDSPGSEYLDNLNKISEIVISFEVLGID
jgi:hypothetical protein